MQPAKTWTWTVTYAPVLLELFYGFCTSGRVLLTTVAGQPVVGQPKHDTFSSPTTGRQETDGKISYG